MLVSAIQSGDQATLKRLLDEHPELASARISGVCDRARTTGELRSLMHIVTDWPGHFPNGAATVATLLAAGADSDAPFAGGRHAETPLHWAASSDDVAVLDALLDGGANIEATGSIIGGGTALADAVAFGQWRAARRLVERGARATLWQAAALGLMDRVKAFFAGEPLPTRDEITNAFWSASHGGQREAAEYLLGRGAELNWVGYGGQSPLDIARRSGADAVVEWLVSQGARTGRETAAPTDSQDAD